MRGSISFFSQTLDKECKFEIVLPERDVWDGGIAIPTLYMLHGMKQDASMWLRYTNIERYVAELPLAVVFPDAHRSIYANQKTGYQYFDYIAKEIPQVVRSYFNLSVAREDNFVAGMSMGGYGAVKVALTYPDQFGGAISLSGVLDYGLFPLNPTQMLAQNPLEIMMLKKENPLRFQEVNDFLLSFGSPNEFAESENDLVHLAAKLPKEMFPDLFVYVGRNDFIYETNQTFLAKLKCRGIPYSYFEDDGDHEWGSWDYWIRQGLSWLIEKRTGGSQ